MTIPTALQNRIKATSQAVRWGMALGSVFQFRAFCCNIVDSDDIMGVSKDPVPLLTLNPNPACVGDPIAWDLRESYAPSSAGAIAWVIDFDDGIGHASGAAMATAFGEYTYASGSGSGEGAEDIADTYLVTAEITAGGLSQDLERELEIEDCKEVNKSLSWSYVGTDGEGVWYINWGIGQAGSGSGSGTGGGGGSGSGTGSGSVIPMWVAKNTGLTGTALNVRHLAMKPGSEVRAPETHELWAATEGGVYKTTNGGESWAKIELPDPSNDEFQDVTPVMVGQLDYRWIAFSTGDSNTIYVLTSKS